MSNFDSKFNNYNGKMGSYDGISGNSSHQKGKNKDKNINYLGCGCGCGIFLLLLLPIVLFIIPVLSLFSTFSQYTEENMGEQYSSPETTTVHTWYHHKEKENNVFFIHPDSERIIKENKQSYDKSPTYLFAKENASRDCSNMGGNLLTLETNEKITFACIGIKNI